VKHVGPYHPGPLIMWVTHHERFSRSTRYPALVPPHVPSWLHQALVHLGIERPPAPPVREATLPLGTLLQQARQAHGLSQQAVGERCARLPGQPVARKHVSSLECHQCLPSLPLLQALVLVLDLDPAAVLTAQLVTTAAAVQASPLEPHAHS